MPVKIILILFLSLPLYSQVTLDSNEVSRLIDKLNEREYLLKNDSLNTRALAIKDTIIFNLETVIKNDSTIISNQEGSINNLRKDVARLTEAGLQWYWWVAIETGVLIIGILTGLIIK